MASCTVFPIKESGRQKRKSRERCPHRPADLPEDSNFLGQPCRNRPAEFARCTRCPPGACQRRLLPLPVSVMLIFKCFLVQMGDFISYGVCKFICLSSFMYNRFHKELRFFFSLLKRKKEAKKEKSSHSTCTVRFQYHPKITQETVTIDSHQQNSPGGAYRRLLPP